VGFGEGSTEGEGDDNIVGVLGGAVDSCQPWVLSLSSVASSSHVVFLLGRAYSAEMPLAEGVMCETMDLRRSVIVFV
jgi:hypothetical protein